MRLLKPSNNFIQIVLMGWINQAFKLGPKTCVRLIIIKKQYDIQNIFLRNERKASKNYFKVMYGHSKWFPHNFELEFGSIQINFLTKVCKSTFSQVLWRMQFSKNLFFVFLDGSKCSANYDLKSAYLYVQKDAK